VGKLSPDVPVLDNVLISDEYVFRNSLSLSLLLVGNLVA